MDVDCLQPGTQAGRPEDNFLPLLFTFQLQPFLHPCSFVLLSHSLAGHMCRPLNTLSLQLQATVLGLLASVMATLLGWMAEGKMPLHHVVILCSASVSTAFMASLLQGKKNTQPVIATLYSNLHSPRFVDNYYQSYNIYKRSHCLSHSLLSYFATHTLVWRSLVC